MNGFLGVDPGLSGAIAEIGADLSFANCFKMPDTERDTLDVLKAITYRTQVLYAVIEELPALPAFLKKKLGIRRGSVATFKLAQNYGSCRMGLTAINVRWEEKVPRTWRKLVGLQPHEPKSENKSRAQQLFPSVKVTNWNADALLIGYAARILWINTSPENAQEERTPHVEPKSKTEGRLF